MHHYLKASGDLPFIIEWYTSFSDQAKESTYFVPFSPGFKTGFFDANTVSLNATMTSDDKTAVMQTLWNMRNTYGLMTAQATHKAMTDPDY